MNYVKVITGIGFAVSIIGGLFIMVNMPYGGSGFIIGLLIAAIGCLLAWINGFILYGFGKLIDNTEQLNELNSMRESLDILNYNVGRLVQLQHGGVQNAEQGSQVNTGNAFMEKQEEVYREEESAVETERKQQECREVFSFPTREEGDIYCPNCGSQQRGNRDKCWECGAGFVYEDEQ